MAAYEWKAQESSSCSVYEAGCLNQSSAHAGILKKQALIPVKEWIC